MLLQDDVNLAATEALHWLTQEKMLAGKNDEWYPRPFGKATMASCIDLTISVRLKEVCCQLHALRSLDQPSSGEPCRTSSVRTTRAL